MITYGHEKYIREAIQGVLMQECNFEVEFIIADDASPDNTEQEVASFKNHANSHWIKYTKHKKNKGMMPNFLWAISQTQGKYIALCEGDDYWTDPYKLQKQVDFLESNSEYGICAHRVQSVNEFDSNKNYIFPDNTNNQDYTIQQFIKSNLVATCSLMFRKDFFQSKPWHQKSPFGDILLTLTILKNSNQKLWVFFEVMGIYRIHSNGVHGKFHQSNVGLIKAYEQHLDFNKLIKKYLLFESKYQSHLKAKEVETYRIILSLLDKKESILKLVKYQFLLKLNN